jgi:hypothetical protein
MEGGREGGGESLVLCRFQCFDAFYCWQLNFKSEGKSNDKSDVPPMSPIMTIERNRGGQL